MLICLFVLLVKQFVIIISLYNRFKSECFGHKQTYKSNDVAQGPSTELITFIDLNPVQDNKENSLANLLKESNQELIHELKNGFVPSKDSKWSNDDLIDLVLHLQEELQREKSKSNASVAQKRPTFARELSISSSVDSGESL